MNEYTVRKIGGTEAKRYIIENHYSRGCHNRPFPCYGLFSGEDLIGVMAFAVPCSERVRAAIFGKGFEREVIELHRLHVLDGTPKNTESWFISQCFKLLEIDRPATRAVVSFADSTEGHKGVIYRATNAMFYGMSVPIWFWLDENGRLRHPRQNGVNIDGYSFGWTRIRRDSKYRYLWLIGNAREKRKWGKLLKPKISPYPQDE